MSGAVADVCLVLEGTYPYVRGGVSSWVHALVAGMPELSFAILLVSARRDADRERAYTLPANVVRFTEVFIHEAVNHREPTPGRRGRRAFWKAVDRFHGCPAHAERLGPFRRMLEGLADPRRRVQTTDDVLYSPRAWRYLVARYERGCPEESFIDFVWTWRAIHAPVMQLLNAEIPPARVYHLVSTGYAGLAGMVARLRFGRPVLLTEHGIYVRERQIDIARADWIHEAPRRVNAVRREVGALKSLWTRFFVRLGELTYAHCDEVLTLFEGNRRLQLSLGCPPERARVVPNGVRTERFAPLRSAAPRTDGIRHVALIGRVVPIKDVKTFVKACALVARDRDDVRFHVCGPTDEDPAYVAECTALRDALGLADRLDFVGNVDVRAWLPRLDAVVLTSISEGQPLILLEAACAGVPAVATDVGGCRELLEGSTPEDRALGPSGLVTRVGDPRDTADAILRLVDSPAEHRRFALAGIQRVERFYRQADVLAFYRALYERWRHAPDAALPSDEQAA